MCSHCSTSHPDEVDFVNGFNKRRQEGVVDALGQDIEQNVLDFAIRMKDFKTVLEISWSRYMLRTIANLVGHRSGPSFVPRRNS